MAKNIEVKIELDGKDLSAFSSVSISQEFNAHHSFEVVVNHDVLQKFGTSTLDTSGGYIGKFITISFGEKDSNAHRFKGIVTEISIDQQRGSWANISLKGHSPTFLLEGPDHYHSFYTKKLQNIVEEVLGNMPGNVMSRSIKPVYSGVLTYMCQYKESHFQFLNRLAAEYGEWFYYDGEKLHFGKPDNQAGLDLRYGEDIEDLSLSLRVVPGNVTHLSYNSSDDKVLTSPAPGDAGNVSNYAKHAISVSDSLFIKPVKQAPLIRTKDKEALDLYSRLQKSRQASSTVLLRLRGSNPKVKVGNKIKISISRKDGGKETTEDHGEYLVTRIHHHISGTRTYTHNLDALPAQVEVIPVQTIKPLAETQMAIVKDNNDPKKMGRIRVQMIWQQEKGEMTDWIRVLSPDAGSSDKVSKNRGFVFIPEVGDQVLVGFRYNDPNRPFVLGSMFHGKTASGGGNANKTKSLTTRSGSTVTLDDDKGSVTISDPSGNSIVMNGDGTITITAPEKIDIISKLININGEDQVNINSKEINVLGSNKVKTETDTLTSLGKKSAEIKSNVKLELSSPATSMEGKTSLALKGTMIDMDGKAITNVKGGMLNLNC